MPPELNVAGLARTTRKTIERLAPFSQMRLPSSSSDSEAPAAAAAITSKISSKILAYIEILDSSMLAAQIAFHLAIEGLVLSTSPQDQEWEVDFEGTIERMRAKAERGLEEARKVERVTRDVPQEFYKIAALTKDKTTIVLLPPDPVHPPTLRKALKDVGTDLVANLNLLSELSQRASETAAWWSWVRDDLLSSNSVLLSSPSTQWEPIKSDWQEYYNIINSAHGRFPDLLSSSRAAWQSVAVKTRDASPLASAAASTATLHMERDTPKLTKRRSGELKTLMQRLIPGRNQEKESGVDDDVGGREKREPQLRTKGQMFLDGLRHLGCHGCIIV